MTADDDAIEQPSPEQPSPERPSPERPSPEQPSLDQLREDPEAWAVDQELDVAAEVYDPRRRNIHELDDDDMLERFRTLLGFDVSWEPPATNPPATPPPATNPPGESG